LANDYDVWLSDWRLSILVDDHRRQSNIYGGAYDHAAAIKIILKETGVKNIQVVAHCVGSLTLWAGLLKGDIEGVGAIVSSQVANRPINSTADRIKRSLQLVPIFEKLLGQEEFDCVTHSPSATLEEQKDPHGNNTPKKVTLLDRAIDNALRFMPMPIQEYCNNAICHRASFCFGLLWEHDKLSKNMHDNLEEILGSMNMESLKTLVMGWAKKETLTDAEGVDLSTSENLKRLENIPVLLIHGAKNQVFVPDATVKTVEELRNTNLPMTNMAYDFKSIYRREVIPGYGHLDCIVGDRAYQDVYPIILKQLESNLASTGYSVSSEE
jgi:cholesterol oxidase